MECIDPAQTTGGQARQCRHTKSRASPPEGDRLMHDNTPLLISFVITF